MTSKVSLTHFLVISGLWALAFILAQVHIHKLRNEIARLELAVAVELHTDSLTEDCLAQYIRAVNIEYPEVAFAQAMMESNRLTSNLVVTNNNLFGMKHPAQRATTSLESKGGYAFYSDWTQSVIDYALWREKYTSHCETRHELLIKLSRAYAQDPAYVAKLQSDIEKFLLHY